jgi:hypothetical protein
MHDDYLEASILCNWTDFQLVYELHILECHPLSIIIWLETV